MATELQLFAVEKEGPRLVPVPAGATSVHDIFEQLPSGVYTSLCTFDHNKFLHLTDHIERLETSMAGLGLVYPLDREALRRALHQVCTDFPGLNSRVRLDVLAAPAASLGVESRLLIALAELEPLPEEVYELGVRVGIARRLHRRQPRVKEAAFARRRREILVQEPDLIDYLLVDPGDRLLEGTTSNFYGFRSGALFTAGEGVLEGIARKIVLQLAGELDIPVVFTPVAIDEIGQLDEAALSSSSRALVPIVEIDSRRVADGRPGRLTRQLLTAYRAYQAKEIWTAVDQSAT